MWKVLMQGAFIMAANDVMDTATVDSPGWLAGGSND
jgi:hypothetical protein